MQEESKQMTRKLNVSRLVLPIVFALIPIIVSASPMKRNNDGKLVVSENGFSRNKLICNTQFIQVLYGGELTSDSGYTFEYAYMGRIPPTFKDITNSISDFVEDEHDMKALELKCLPSEEKIGIFIPSQSEDIKALYIMVIKDGRVINGYSLSGHDQTGVTNTE